MKHSNLLTAAIVLTCIGQTQISHAETQQVTLSASSNVRVDKCLNAGKEALCRIASLPPGSVVEFEKADFENAKNFAYTTESGGLKDSKNGFVRGFRVISIPGEETNPELKELKDRINNYTVDMYIAKNYLSVTEDNSKYVAGDYTATISNSDPEGSNIFSVPGREGTPPPPIDTGATAEQEVKEATDRANSAAGKTEECTEEAFPGSAVPGTQFMAPMLVNKVLDYRGPNGERVPPQALANALNYFTANKSKFKNRRYMTIIDYTKSSRQQRMFLIRNDGVVKSYFVAHGRGSGEWKVSSFSNKAGSKATSQGFYSTGSDLNECSPKKRPCMWLNGLEAGLNSNARSREVIFHAADYVANGGPGRSHGCPAVRHSDADEIREATHNGSLWYHYAGETRPTL